jgi:tectonin-like protein
MPSPYKQVIFMTVPHRTRVPYQTGMGNLKLASFVKIPGSLATITVAGAVYGLNLAHELYKWDAHDQAFFNFLEFYKPVNPFMTPSPGSTNPAVIQIAQPPNSLDILWAIDSTHAVYRLTYPMVTGRGSAVLARVPAPPLQQLITDDTYVWGIDDSHRVYRRFIDDHGPLMFQQVQGSLVQIASWRGDAWGIDSVHHIHRCQCHTDSPDSTFQQVPGSLAQIAVGFDVVDCEEVWGVNDANQVYRFNQRTGRFDQVPGSLRSIAVGPDGVWGLNQAGEIYRFNKAKGAFDQVPGSLAKIALSPDSQGFGVWGINRLLEIFRFQEAP